MKGFFNNKTQLGPLACLLIYLGLGGFILLFTVFLQPGGMLYTLRNFLRVPLLLGLNLLPILAVLGILYALTGNLFFAGSLSSLLFHLLSLVNLIKMECRKDPFVPADFTLLGEAMTATGEYQLNLHIPYLLLILLMAGLLFALGFKFRTRRKPWQRGVIALALAGLLALGMFTAYPSAPLYEKMVASVNGLNYANVPKVFDELGWVYCFLHNFGLYEVQRPAGYDRAEAAAWAESPAEPLPGGALPVNVVFVQCEAFSDLFDSPAFAYSPEENPMYLFHQVAESPRAISGRIVVSNYGAGTANTEFDVLTGMQTNMLNEVPTSALRVIHKNSPSLARTFTALGYEGWFMHPGDRWFYNRESSYNFLGLHDQFFKDSFVDPVIKGSWISDETFGKTLLEHYEAHRAVSDAPWFAFTVTVQNHQSYPWTKYDFRMEDAKLKEPVSDATLETLSVYAEGIRDSSRLLRDLTTYFDQEAAPTLLIFWGDHLPALGGNFSVYREIGSEVGDESKLDAALDTYSTPFVIWANAAYDDAYDLQGRIPALELPAGDRISDIYLGELVYELLDMQGSDAYFDYLAQARRILPVICKGRYELPDGSQSWTLDPAQQSVVDKLYKWTYYRVMDQRIAEE